MDRIDKINQRIKREVGDIVLKELKDPRLEFVTITKVEVSRDLRHAKVYFSVLGNAQKLKEAQEGLESARGFVRKLIGARVRMRYTPEMEFFYDRTIEYSARIEAALQEIHHELGKDH